MKHSAKRHAITAKELINELQSIVDENGDLEIWLTDLTIGTSGPLEHMECQKAHSEFSDMDKDIIELTTRKMNVDLLNGLELESK